MMHALAGESFGKNRLCAFMPVKRRRFAWMRKIVEPIGLVADATYVYWVAGQGLATSVYRASRAGDGSDATAIHSGDTFVPVVAFGGYLWSGGVRLPVDGGLLAVI